MTDSHQPPSNESPLLRDDPVVEQIRAIRRQLWEEAGRDIPRYIEQSRRNAERFRAAQRKAPGPVPETRRQRDR